MELSYLDALPKGGFNYDNCLRNKAIEQNTAGAGTTGQKHMKTGTTICGIVFKVGFKII